MCAFLHVIEHPFFHRLACCSFVFFSHSRYVCGFFLSYYDRHSRNNFFFFGGQLCNCLCLLSHLCKLNSISCWLACSRLLTFVRFSTVSFIMCTCECPIDVHIWIIVFQKKFIQKQVKKSLITISHIGWWWMIDVIYRWPAFVRRENFFCF